MQQHCTSFETCAPTTVQNADPTDAVSDRVDTTLPTRTAAAGRRATLSGPN